MSESSDRIVKIVTDLCDGNRSKFARRLSISPQYAAQLYSGERSPSDRTIADICRVFDIREEWLRDGLEPMRSPKNREEEVVEMVGRALKDGNSLKQAVIQMICNRTDEELEVIKKAISDIYENL